MFGKDNNPSDSEIQKLKQFQQVVDASLCTTIIATDLEGTITFFNKGAEKILGYAASEVIGKTTPMIFHDLHEVEKRGKELSEEFGYPISGFDIFSVHAKNGIYDEHEWTYIKKNGAFINVILAITPILDDTEKIVGYLGTAIDITEQKATEEQLRQSQKMEVVGQLAGGVAHDFNNMLTGILGAATLLQEMITNHPEQRELLNIISLSANNAAQLTRKLLTFSRKGTLNTHEIHLHDLIVNLQDILHHTIQGIVIELSLAASVDLIKGDQSQIENGLMNLAINARDAMSGKGTLTIASHNYHTTETTPLMGGLDLIPGDYIVVSLTDTGCGISPELCRRIFEPFFTTKETDKGTGLGLASLYGTIKELHGAIDVKSTVGVGTTFELYIPTLHP